ncbi:MAG: response regulator transcription factor [Lachnospiraceae bacterium]|nr:response regulator transcription factor [Lachnospiraceae bacterium]MBR4588768.1 response regulator transcription factor [Lachnospiraceae bacterium]
MSRILVVDDEKNIVKGLKLYLENDGDNVDAAYDGEEAMALVKEAVKLPKDERYDAILLDVMLPKLDGFEVLQQIREIDDVPVIMLTAKGEDMDKILGLEYGADDYITKPFNVLEVKARLKAIMRRSKPKKENGAEGGKVIKIGDLVLESDAKRVISSGREINLTAKEYDLLDLLANNPDKVYSREDLLRIVWGYDFPGDVRTVDVHIRRLREKIEDNPGEPRYVQTKWGRGYYLKP